MAVYNQNLLNVDLSSGKISEETLSERMIEQYIGGYGLAVRLFYERIPQNADPLGEENLLGFFPGLLTGSMAPFTGRYLVCGKSPLTGTWGDSNSGGFFGPEITKSGYVGIVFSGISKKPVYLLIKDGKASLEDADKLWGLDAVETDLELQKIHGKKTKVAAIGQGGERICLNAGIVNDKGRIAARSGLGAVMGSKKLKALALQGNQRYQYEDKKSLIPLLQKYQKRLKKGMDSKFWKTIVDNADPAATLFRLTKIPSSANVPISISYMHHYGTPYFLYNCVENGDSPIKNWAGVGHRDFGKKISKPLTAKAIVSRVSKPYGCFSCPIRCGGIIEAPEIGIEETHKPEYETISALGPLLLHNNQDELIKINEYLNRTGVDTISMGGILAFSIECMENGIITKKDTGGLEIGWNKHDDLLDFVKMIVERKNIGDILADGVKIASKKIGKGSEKYAVHANGQELPMHDSRYYPSLGATYIADPTPGRHTSPSTDIIHANAAHKFIKGLKEPKSKRYKYDKKGDALVFHVKMTQTIYSLGYCMFATFFGEMPLLDIVKYIVGWEWTNDDLFEIGYRIQTLRQLFNAKHDAINFEMNERPLGIPPLEKGPLKGVTLDAKTMIKDYFEKMGWDPKTGIPTEETIKKLDLDFAFDALDHQDENKTIEQLPDI